MERYKAQISLSEIGRSGQELLKEARVGIIGMGGLGCPAAQCLVSAGIGHILLIDGDKIEMSNLSRQFLYSETDIGENKAKVSAERLNKINPSIKLDAIGEHITTENIINHLSGVDLILDCGDDLSLTLVLDQFCEENAIPLIFGSVHKWEGQVTVLHHNGGPGFQEIFNVDDKISQLNCNDLGALVTTTSVVGSMQANEAIKLLTNSGELLSGFISLLDLKSFEVMKIKVNKVKKDKIIYSTPKSIEFGDLVEVVSDSMVIYDLRENKFGDSKLDLIPLELDDLENAMKDFTTDQLIVFVCETDKKSKAACHYVMRKRPEINVQYLKGGIKVKSQLT